MRTALALDAKRFPRRNRRTCLAWVFILRPSITTKFVWRIPSSALDVMKLGMSIPGLDASTLGLSAPLDKMNASVQKLLASSPDAIEYLQSFHMPFLEKPGPRDGAGESDP